MKRTRAVRPGRGETRKKRAKKSKLVVANWKMNPPTLAEAKRIFAAIRRSARRLSATHVVVCPPALYAASLAGDEMGVGVQDVSQEFSGAHTGEIGAEMAKAAGAELAIVGHSERRAKGESDAIVARKLAAALQSGLQVVLCVGEQERDYEGRYLAALADQIKWSLSGVARRDLDSIVIAYEPVWAIGKRAEESITGHDLHESALYIRKVLTGVYGKDYAFKMKILYGGSVFAGNARDIVAEGGVSGLLVGRQSLEPAGFAEVLDIIDSV